MGQVECGAHIRALLLDATFGAEERGLPAAVLCTDFMAERCQEIRSNDSHSSCTRLRASMLHKKHVNMSLVLVCGPSVIEVFWGGKIYSDQNTLV